MEETGYVMRVLVAEDVEDLAAAIAAGLRREGMAVDVVLDGAAALDHLGVTLSLSRAGRLHATLDWQRRRILRGSLS